MAELLLLVLFGVVLWLFNVVLPAWFRRRQSDAARDVERPGPPVVQRPRTPPPLGAAARGTPLPAVPPLVATPQRVPVWPGRRRDIRRGIVLMTILGPCRALESPDSTQ
jgi:hypothetical protein